MKLFIEINVLDLTKCFIDIQLDNRVKIARLGGVFRWDQDTILDRDDCLCI